ncbi:MAG: aminodeoxychorismate synthase component I [Candidatus Omnitrophota bacterium]
MAYYILKSYKLRFQAEEVYDVFNRQANSFFLDSSLNSNACGNFSFLGYEPFYILKTKNQSPFKQLRGLLDKYKIPPSKQGVPFFTGAVGYLAYDLGLFSEDSVRKKDKSDLGIPDCYFAFYNNIAIIDHRRKMMHILATGFPEKNKRLGGLLAEKNFKKIYKLLSGINPKNAYCKEARPMQGKVEANFTKDAYILAVKRVKEYIKRGDIYQANLSQQFKTRSDLSAREIYLRLRKASPTQFSAYLDCGDFQILSSSPERFLKVQGKRISTMPMKGTASRSHDKQKDQRLREGLLKSRKDQAELLMIVDLERNDLGRVCSYDSIKVAKLRELEAYKTVYQTTATVEGRLHADKDRIDLLKAAFPGGSVTGCPKIRAMEIIEELEPHRRSIYTGCLGYLSFCGGMDFNILIRTILKKGKEVYFAAGGGIVADSVPIKEYEETIVKSRAMVQVINAY